MRITQNSDTEPSTPPSTNPSTGSGTLTVTTVAAAVATPQSKLLPFQQFNPSVDPSTVGQRWKKRVCCFEIFI